MAVSSGNLLTVTCLLTMIDFTIMLVVPVEMHHKCLSMSLSAVPRGRRFDSNV